MTETIITVNHPAYAAKIAGKENAPYGVDRRAVLRKTTHGKGTPASYETFVNKYVQTDILHGTGSEVQTNLAAALHGINETQVITKIIEPYEDSFVTVLHITGWVPATPDEVAAVLNIVEYEKNVERAKRKAEKLEKKVAAMQRNIRAGVL